MSTFLSDASVRAMNSFVTGYSPSIQGLNSHVEEIARTDIPVLLTGESGTGKEVYARMIHRLSKRAHMPLKKVSCRAIAQAELLTLKSDLRQCTENSADGPGTLFLDSIDELDLDSQKALLSLLPDGETDENNLNRWRLIASTTRNLEKEIESGRFRRELYFRINAVCLRLPPLRDRKEDIRQFLTHFLLRDAAELGHESPLLSDTDVEFLMMYNWPGNVRELENLAKRIVLLGDSRRAIQELRETTKLASLDRPEQQSLSLKAAARTASRKAERDLIAKALEHTHWNRKRAAQQLQISYKSLLYKIKQTGLEDK